MNIARNKVRRRNQGASKKKPSAADPVAPKVEMRHLGDMPFRMISRDEFVPSKKNWKRIFKIEWGDRHQAVLEYLRSCNNAPVIPGKITEQLFSSKMPRKADYEGLNKVFARNGLPFRFHKVERKLGRWYIHPHKLFVVS